MIKNVKSRFKFGAPAALLAVAIALSGCGSSNGDNGSGNAASAGASPAVSEAAKPAKQEKISFIHWRSEDAESFNAIIAQFEQEYPNIKVEMQTFPSGEYQSIAQQKLLDGSVGDVFASFPGAQFSMIAQSELYTDLTGSPFIDNFEPSLVEAGQRDGKQLALPYQLVYNMPIYNVGLFEKYGLEPPKDWDGFLALGEKLKAEGIIPIAYPGDASQFMNTMLMNNAPDEQIFQKLEAGETKLGDEWWIKTLTQIKELNDKSFFQKDASGSNSEAAIALFVQEKAAMIAAGSYAIVGLKKANPNLQMKLLAPITVPADQAVYEGIHTTTFMLGVNAKSKHQEAAKTFISFLSRSDIAGKYANETGQNVTIKGVEYTSPELKDIAEWTTRKTRFQPRYLIQNIEVQKAVVSSIQSVLSGATPEQAAKDSQAIIDQQVDK